MGDSLLKDLDRIGEQALKDVSAAASLDAIEQVRIAVLGKKGALSEVLKGLGTASAADRPKIGAAANAWKQKIEGALEEKKSKLEGAALAEKLKTDRIDTTLPARMPHKGSLHPVTQVTRRMIEIFGRIGFDVMTGPEAETDFLNFEAVNMPADHPARDMQDTFFLGPGVVLRTHTSSVQMRAMRSQSWPLRVLAPGAVYRADSDATHSPMFHQLEGLWIDKNVRMSDLKGTLLHFARELFGADAQIRLRPSYFPFVEPGAEVDISCFQCKGKGSVGSANCSVCRGSGWLEILGAGMVHPKLFELAGYLGPGKPEPTGFAFGVGIERVAMLLHGIPDLRMMFHGDVRFLNQF
jgi:phenylalanyl-tRNA synthetase alpha chain